MDTRQATYSYTSTGSAVAIKDKASASKAMTLTDNETITDLNVTVNLNHTRYADLKFELIGPNNVTRVLCNAGGVTGSGTKTLVFDDDGAAGSIRPVNRSAITTARAPKASGRCTFPIRSRTVRRARSPPSHSMWSRRRSPCQRATDNSPGQVAWRSHPHRPG